MRGALLVALVSIAAAVAGCAGTKDEALADPDPVVDEAPLLALAACENPFSFCYEATIARLDDGTLVVSNGLGPSLARLAPADAAFTPMPAPRVPAGAAPGVLQTDAMVLADGPTLYYSALLGDYSPPAGNIWLMGIQLARSDDAGTTWSSNLLLNLPEGADSTFGADRQWVAARGEDVYVSFQQVSPVLGGDASLALSLAAEAASAIRVAASHDGGHSFGSFVEAFPRVAEPASHIGGPPVVLPDGRLAVPALRYRPVSPSSIEVAVSADGGATFQPIVVSAGDPIGDFFPILAEGSAGLALAWRQEGRIVTAESDDGGRSWTAPVARMGPDGSTGCSPWLAALPGGDWVLHVAVADPENTSASTLRFEVGPPGDPLWHTADFEARVAHPPGGRPNTDFTHFVLAEADAWAVWVDDGRVLVQRIALA